MNPKLRTECCWSLQISCDPTLNGNCHDLYWIRTGNYVSLHLHAGRLYYRDLITQSSEKIGNQIQPTMMVFFVCKNTKCSTSSILLRIYAWVQKSTTSMRRTWIPKTLWTNLPPGHAAIPSALPWSHPGSAMNRSQLALHTCDLHTGTAKAAGHLNGLKHMQIIQMRNQKCVASQKKLASTNWFHSGNIFLTPRSAHIFFLRVWVASSIITCIIFGNVRVKTCIKFSDFMQCWVIFTRSDLGNPRELFKSGCD